MAFRQQLKTVLFITSYGEYANIWAASLFTRDYNLKRIICLFKNNNTGPKATNVLQQKKNKHTNTE